MIFLDILKTISLGQQQVSSLAKHLRKDSKIIKKVHTSNTSLKFPAVTGWSNYLKLQSGGVMNTRHYNMKV